MVDVRCNRSSPGLRGWVMLKRIRSSTETIYALASAAGRAGVSVIRVSGPDVREIIQSLATRKAVELMASPRKLVRCDLWHGDQLLDQAMAVYFRGPASFTGEDVLELHVHGSPAILRRVFACLEGQARLAKPGEFCQRAFLAGKMDLAQAEALADLIQAQSEQQRRVSLAALQQGSSMVMAWRQKIVELTAGLEAYIDFGDDEQFKPEDVLNLDELQQLEASMLKQLRLSKDVELVRSGLTIVLVGPPNVGKSSLMNRLAGRRTSIVSPQAGTTRDLIRATIELDGHQVNLVDTAGLNEASQDPIEQEGIQLTKEAMNSADFILFLHEDGLEYRKDAPRIIPVLAKADRLKLNLASAEWLASSTDDGLFDSFKKRLSQLVSDRLSEVTMSDPVLIRERHRACIERCLYHLSLARQYLQEKQDAVVAAESMRLAGQAVGEVSGRTIDHEDILNSIFSNFCIGK